MTLSRDLKEVRTQVLWVSKEEQPGRGKVRCKGPGAGGWCFVGRTGVRPEWLEKENLGVKGRRWGLSHSCCICWAMSTTLGLYSRGFCAKPDLHFRRTTVATVWRKRASVATCHYYRIQGRKDGGLDPGRGRGSGEKWPHSGYLKVKLPGFAVEQEVGCE